MKISEHLTEELICIDLAPGSVEEIVDRLANLLFRSGAIHRVDEVRHALLEREQVSSTGIGSGVAIPHARSTETDKLLVCCALCPKGTDFNALDTQPVHIFFAVIAPREASGLHLKLLAAISRIMSDDGLRHQILNALSSREVLEIIRRAEAAQQ